MKVIGLNLVEGLLHNQVAELSQPVCNSTSFQWSQSGLCYFASTSKPRVWIMLVKLESKSSWKHLPSSHSKSLMTHRVWVRILVSDIRWIFNNHLLFKLSSLTEKEVENSLFSNSENAWNGINKHCFTIEKDDAKKVKKLSVLFPKPRDNIFDIDRDLKCKGKII